MVGSLVKEKNTKQESLEHLSAKELINAGKKMDLHFQLTDEELKTVLNPLEAIVERKHIGGSSSEIMKRMIKNRKKLSNSYSNWVTISWAKINAAKEKTDKAINNIEKSYAEITISGRHNVILACPESP